MASKYTYEFNVNDNVIATFGSNRYEGRILKRHGGRYQIEYKERGKWFTEWFGQSTVTARPVEEVAPTPPANSEPDHSADAAATIERKVNELNEISARQNRGRARLQELKNTTPTANAETAPANSEPQADITPADYAAVEAMGETEANVFGDDYEDEPTCAHCGEEIRWSENRKGHGDELYHVDCWNDVDFSALRDRNDALASRSNPFTPNVLDVPASDEIASEDAQPEGALTDDERAVLEYLDCDEPFSWSEIYNGMKSINGNALDTAIDGLEAKGFIDYDKEEIVTRYYPTQTGRAALAQPAKTHEQRELERQHAEIRALESKLAAAVAALRPFAALASELHYGSNSVQNEKSVVYGRNDKAITVADIFAARKVIDSMETALQQSGAGEG